MRRLAAAVLALALVAAACRSAPAPEPQRPVPGGVLRVAVRDLASLDPALATGQGAQAAIAQLYDTLTSIAPDGALQPAAASSWRVSRDGLQWLFVLREGRLWSDGTVVTAADFKRAFDRIARRSIRSDAAFALEHVRGFREVHDSGSTDKLTGVTALNARQLRITLSRPFAELPYVLAHPRLAPAPPPRSGGAAPTNGPFRIDAFTRDRSARLVRNERYTGSTALVEAIELTVASSAEDPWRLYQNGSVDIAEAPASATEAEITDAPSWATLAFGLNVSLAKYAKPEVRRAISLAIDREAIARTVYGGTKTPATGILPQGIRGFRAGACSACALDRNRARTIVRAAFGTKPPTIVIDHLTERSSKQVAQAISANLREVGFRTQLRQHSLQAYRAFLAAGRQDLAQLGWISDVSSPDGFLAQQLRTNSADNQTNFRDGVFDYRIDRARAERDEARRLALYQQAERRALELMPLIPIVFFRARTAVAPRVRAYRTDGAGVFDGTAVWLARG